VNGDVSTTCLFSNVLYKDGRITLFQDPHAPINQLTSSVFLNDIPPNFLTIASGPVTAHQERYRVSIAQNTTDFPQHIAYEEAQLALIYAPFAPHNQGHFMFDEAFALHQSLCEFGLFGMEPQIYITEIPVPRMYTERMHAVSKRPVNSLGDRSPSARRHRSEGLLFQNLLIGVSPYSYGMRDARRKSLSWQIFKYSYLENLHLSSLAPRKHQITFI